jgi:hypothetical protein
MKRVTILKAALDVALTLGFLLLMEPKATGMSLHEWGGLGICVFFVIHKLLNRKWIAAVSAALFRRGTPAMTRLRYVVDVVLLAGFSLIAVSGMAIAHTIGFSWLFHAAGSWKVVHVAGSSMSLVAVGVHLGLHADWIKGRLRGLLPVNGRSSLASVGVKGESNAL